MIFFYFGVYGHKKWKTLKRWEGTILVKGHIFHGAPV